MTDIAEFLRARLHEEEAWATAARGWQTGSRHEGQPLDWSIHMDRWSPDRVLADVEAKRRIVELHEPKVTTWPKADNMDPYVEKHCTECGTGTQSWGPGDPGDFEPSDWPCLTLYLLALPYADHPDYREEWRP